MFYRLLSVLAFLFISGCGAVQTRAAAPEAFAIRRSAGREGTYAYATGAAGVNEKYYIVLDAMDSYYHRWPSNLPGSVTFTVTVHPDTVALAPFYVQMPEGVEISPRSFILGGGDSYYPLRSAIAFDRFSIQIRHGAPEESFSFEAPGGIRAGFEVQILELSDGDTGEPRHVTVPPCPSGYAFTVVMAHESFASPDAVVRYVGRSSWLSCRYTIDLIEDSPFPPRAAEAVN